MGIKQVMQLQEHSNYATSYDKVMNNLKSRWSYYSRGDDRLLDGAVVETLAVMNN